MHKNHSLLSSSDNSAYLLGEIELHLLRIQWSQKSQHTALAFSRIFLAHMLQLISSFLLLVIKKFDKDRGDQFKDKIQIE